MTLILDLAGNVARAVADVLLKLDTCPFRFVNGIETEGIKTGLVVLLTVNVHNECQVYDYSHSHPISDSASFLNTATFSQSLGMEFKDGSIKSESMRTRSRAANKEKCPFDLTRPPQHHKFKSMHMLYLLIITLFLLFFSVRIVPEGFGSFFVLILPDCDDITFYPPICLFLCVISLNSDINQHIP